ncbi:MAG: acyl-CoA dehydrogenase family protein [Phycisphaerales bacterium JB058]
MAELTTEQREFQEYARRWLEENRPDPCPERLPITSGEIATEVQRDYLQAWQNAVYEAGLIGCDYPTEYGGGGHQGFQGIANREMVRARVPYLLNVVGLSIAAPAILGHGTDAQKRRYLPGILSCEEIWCQGFSEPGAGSDLANQETMAVRDGDDWIVNGHKVWTSLGKFAHWMILLTRTNRELKHDGLTFFLAPVEGTPGLTIRPLVKLTGEAGFNEVLLENVRLPDSLRLDDVGKGWAVTMTALAGERGASESAGRSAPERKDPITRLVELAKSSYRDGRRAADDPVIRDEIAERAIRREGFRQSMRRARVGPLTDHPMRLPLQQKVLSTEFAQESARLGVDIAGAHSTLYKLDGAAPEAGHWPLSYMNSYAGTISQGTNEIQRNILGERVLGLPKTK